MLYLLLSTYSTCYLLLTASAPIWQLAGTVARDTLDMQAVAMTRGVSKAGGATDQCRDNLRAAWPLLREAGRSAAGLKLLGGAAKACAPLGGEGALPTWAQSPYFYMAEGNYPFPSTYITFSVSTGTPSPLPSAPSSPRRPRWPPPWPPASRRASSSSRAPSFH